jgi:NitT/TauT family transport system substrate-binding protein
MRALLLLSFMLVWAVPARAEVSELRVAKQYGLGYLQMMMMEDQKLIEKHAKAAGLGDITVTWATFRSSDVMNDAVISGTVEFVCLGPAGLATIWAKTRGNNIDVRGVAAMNAQPNFLNARKPELKAITDFTDKDRIALPAVKVAFQALALQMAAAKQWGTANFA